MGTRQNNTHSQLHAAFLPKLRKKKRGNIQHTCIMQSCSSLQVHISNRTVVLKKVITVWFKQSDTYESFNRSKNALIMPPATLSNGQNEEHFKIQLREKNSN